MGLFKSREERKIERSMEIKKGINTIKRTIRDLAKNERDYIEKAKRARQLGSKGQLALLRDTVRKTMGQRMLLERQLLAIETAEQMKNQAETYGQFARSMTAVSKAIAEVFEATDMNRVTQDFEKAMANAQTMEERMELFLDMTSDSMGTAEGAGAELVSDAELDQLIDGQVAAEEGSGLNAAISQGLSEIERELKPEKE